MQQPKADSGAQLDKDGPVLADDQQRAVDPRPDDEQSTAVVTPPVSPSAASGAPSRDAGDIQVDWRAIPAPSIFYGRQYESAKLAAWLSERSCRLIAILGMGGQGKTSLAAQVIRRLGMPPANAPNATQGTDQLGHHFTPSVPFTRILWHSLLNAPPLSEILQSWLQQLSHHQLAAFPPLLDQQLTLLLSYLQRHRVLLVLDNLESMMQGTSDTGIVGSFRADYADYQELLRRVGEGEHQSCLLLTSREKPGHMTRMEQTTPAIRSLQLEGLELDAIQAMFYAQAITGSQASFLDIARRYSGNPLALTLVAQLIKDRFAGELDAFIQQDLLLFEDIRHVLDQQFARLSLAEQEIMFWLAIEREPVSLSTLRENLVQQSTRRTVLETLLSLLRRSLLEQQGDRFGLQNVVLEYVTDRLVQALQWEIASRQWTAHSAANQAFSLLPNEPGVAPSIPDIAPADQPISISRSYLNRFALVKATAKDAVRKSQIRLILNSLATQLVATLGKVQLTSDCQTILARLRRTSPLLPGYLAANLLHILIGLDVDLYAFDFSHLAIWQADLRGVRLPAVNFTQSAFKHSVFTDPFTSIHSLAFLADSQYLATGTIAGTILLWHLADQRLHQILTGHTDIVFIVASPDAQHLASAGQEGRLSIWSLDRLNDPDHGQRLLSHQSVAINALVFSPAGDRLFSASDDGAVYEWQWQTQAPPTLLYTLATPLLALAISPDGRFLASGGQDGTIYLWDRGERRLVGQGVGHTDFVWSLAFSPDGTLLASASADQTVRLWHYPAAGHPSPMLSPSAVLSGHTADVYAVAFSPDGTLLASSSDDQTIRLWKPQTQQCIDVLLTHKSWVRAVAFSPDGKILVGGSSDQTISLWDIETTGDTPNAPVQSPFQLRYQLVGTSSFVEVIELSRDGRLLVSGHGDQLIRLWNVPTGKVEATLEGHTGRISSLALSPDDRLMASVGDDGLVRIWELATRQLQHTLAGYDGPLNDVTFSPDGNLLAVGGLCPWLHVWDLRTGQLHQVLHGPMDAIWSINFSPDGQQLAAGTGNQGILCWAVNSGILQQTLSTASATVLNVAFHPTGNLLASSGVDRVVRLWDVAQGQLLQVLDEPPKTILSVAFDPTGSWLAAGLVGGAIYLWRVDQQAAERFAIRFHQRLDGHTIEVSNLAFSADGHWLVSASADETIRFWDLATGTCLKTLRAGGPYEDMNIAHAQGLTTTQKLALMRLGAIER